MDLKAKKEARAARIKAKEEAIRAQYEQIAGSEAEQVAETTPEETKDSKQN